ncbi:MAG: efflux RND transporter periplasmic adaptor subunit [Anaerolineaceae bacterium]
MKFSNLVSPGKPLRKSVRLIIAAVLLVVLTGILVWLFVSSASPVSTLIKGTPTPAYQTSVVKRGDLTISASGQGTLTSGKYVDLSFLTDGVVDILTVESGEKVSAGQELANLDNVTALEAQVASNQLAFLEAQQTLDELQENKDVSLSQAYSDYIAAEQTYADALRMTQRDDYARCNKETNKKYNLALQRATEKLNEIEKRYYGSESWIEAKNNYDQAKANFDYCISYTEDEKTNYDAAMDVAKVTVEKAKTAYEILKASAGIDPDDLAMAEAKVQKASALLALSQANLEAANLVAPIDGTVTYVASNQGAMVEGGTKFMTISDLSQPLIEVNIDETDIDKLKLNATCEIVFDALPDSTFIGKITRIDPELTSSGQIQVATAYVELDEEAAKILGEYPLGLQASVSVIDQQVIDALLVPVTAIREIGAGQYGVFVLNSSGNLRLQLVEVGLMDTARAEIISGLQEGDIVSTGLSSSY